MDVSRHPKSRRSACGFSLVELMVVIVIIGLLATLVVSNVIKHLQTSQGEKAKADITNILSAVELYALNNKGRFPDDLVPLVTPDVNGETYLGRETIPRDPWGNEYLLEPPPSGVGRPLILSYGADGTPGGEGEAADIDSHEIVNQLDDETG